MIRKSGNRFSEGRKAWLDKGMFPKKGQGLLARGDEAGLQLVSVLQGHNPFVLVNYSPTICLNPPS
jgi:hypothetical protein